MKQLFVFLFFLTLTTCNKSALDPPAKITYLEGPLQLHPENPHYFLYQSKPLALITSAEHYGAVLNLDFDYKQYLETLAAEGMNYTRIFTGTYFEIPGESFAIKNNTLAPAPGRLLAPWKYSDSATGKFDLAQENEAYYTRLREFIQLAAEKNIIVEVTLFSSIYRDEHWNINPQNPSNNVNVKANISRFDTHTTNNKDLFDYQKQFVEKIVTELNDFNNIFFEIQNEPWSDKGVAVYNIANKVTLETEWTSKAEFANPAALAWQSQIARIIAATELRLPKQHLIAQNYTNFKAPIPTVDSLISILNFHYAWPEAVEWNYHYDKVIGFDESGFAGTDDHVYRRQAWQFMLSGGGLYNNLDYSFFVGSENGTGQNEAYGGGSTPFRKQLAYLSRFLHSFPLERMYPDKTIVKRSPGLIPYALSDGKAYYGLFLTGIGTTNTTIDLDLPGGNYEVQFINPVTGVKTKSTVTVSADHYLQLEINIPEGELAFKIVKVS